ncbi:hypothetical protein [Bradyrhizobium sp. BR 1433]|uniref:hypothetical protein n=1 Tax=Bradyrhizobium sp. BR 1433 TaxID=3447967 RepID=UPI003EE509B4
MSDARQLLENRTVAIDAELEPLTKEYAELRTKLVEIDMRIRRLQQEREEIGEFLKKTQPSQPRITIMEAILATLDHKTNGLTAQEILSELNEKYFGGSLLRTSLSPQLSRLKDRDKKITLRGDRWFKVAPQADLFKRRP